MEAVAHAYGEVNTPLNKSLVLLKIRPLGYSKLDGLKK